MVGACCAAATAGPTVLKPMASNKAARQAGDPIETLKVVCIPFFVARCSMLGTGSKRILWKAEGDAGAAALLIRRSKRQSNSFCLPSRVCASRSRAQGPAPDGRRPLPVEGCFRGTLVGQVLLAARLGGFIKRQVGFSPAAFFGLAVLPIVGEEAFEGRQKEGSKPASDMVPLTLS